PPLVTATPMPMPPPAISSTEAAIHAPRLPPRGAPPRAALPRAAPTRLRLCTRSGCVISSAAASLRVVGAAAAVAAYAYASPCPRGRDPTALAGGAGAIVAPYGSAPAPA